MIWVENFLYGLLSGFSEFLPVSSNAHQLVFRELFGMQVNPLLDLIVHLAALLSVLFGCRGMLARIRREKMAQRRSTRLRNRKARGSGSYTARLIRTATIPLIIVLMLQSVIASDASKLLVILFLILNGTVLILPEYMRQANKDARSMSGLDGILLGFFGGLSALPGISRTGVVTAFAVARGADRQHAVDWALLLGIPALVVLAGLDVFSIASSGIGVISFPIVISYILAAVAAAFGGYFGIRFIRFLAVRLDFSGFAYYSWGVALFVFILYLIS